MRHGVPDDRAFGPEAVRCGLRSGGGARSRWLNRGAASGRMGRGAGVALHPRSRDYRAAWDHRSPLPGLPERAPFPIRLRTAADAGALRWGLLAWEDPRAERPLAPFWAGAGAVDGHVRRDARSLTELAAEGGAVLTGLRLDDGALMLRIEQGEALAVLVRLPAGTAVSAEDGLMVGRDLARIEDVWLGVPAPPSVRARGERTTNFCWRWKARPRGCRGAGSRRPSGARRGWRRSTTPTAG